MKITKDTIEIILSQIALEEKIPVEVVYAEIQKAIFYSSFTQESNTIPLIKDVINSIITANYRKKQKEK